MIYSLLLSSLFAGYVSAGVYEILMIDTFGDGWKNIHLDVTTDGTTSEYSFNCSCNWVNFTSISDDVMINVTSDGKAIAPWEIYWMIDPLDDGNVVVGNFDTSMYISGGSSVNTHAPVSVDPDNKDNKCHECKHPPPKGHRALSPSPPPPTLIVGELYSSNGWYKGNSTVTGVCDAPLSQDVMDVPDILTYPKYYIMNEQKTKVLKSGTVCKSRTTEYCEDVVPPEGKFVYRVTGFNNDATWEFCGMTGSSNDELVFSMHHGKCTAVVMHSGSDYCTGIVSYFVMAGTLSITDVQGDTLSAFDTKMLEQQIASMFTYQRQVTITSYTTADAVMTVDFKVVLAAEDYGVDGTFGSNIETLASQVATDMKIPVTQGQFITVLKNSLKNSPQGSSDVLSSMSAVTLTSVGLSSIDYGLVPTSKGTPAETPSQEETTVEVHTAREEFALSSSVAYVCAGVACVAILVFAIVRTVKRSSDSETKTHLPLPSDSEHMDINFEVDSEEDAIPTFDLKKTEKSYFKSAERV
mmetsp:Transcript_9304/g.20449  ORF Transcript_9304/g.20449 Transcript_9304/m.20449 type:complete len:523 (+) Transcript_9304:17-1585(+)|eukprot:CAMPEP_0116919022 /NCGR_PEP_ID=MMETSP0467-20121206/20118_1 /TAXON_ID=283647 /ORGANISM="Mesodinium pulex, Strain SPMC105" /LENGTH=522 /DNA_ID=CAMNT_0004596481 /DNA_START=17 /DNA_END=1585 /DNA_ORIENTATION=-